MKRALLFPGQGSQYVGMARDWYEAYPEVQNLFAQAEEILGYDLAGICFAGPEERLTQTQHTQPAIFAHSTAAFTVLQSAGLTFDYVAGHSLGEYSALVANGCLSFHDGLSAVKFRSRFMQEACDEKPGTMAAVIGLPADVVVGICREVSNFGRIQPANFNSPEQIAISGERPGVERAVGLAKEKGALRAMLLPVGGAFHSHLMAPAAERLGEVLTTLSFHPAKVPVVANVTAQPTEDPVLIRKLLVDQITCPVRWVETLQFLHQAGVTEFVEIGPGRVLTGLVRRTLKGVATHSIDTTGDWAGLGAKLSQAALTEK